MQHAGPTGPVFRLVRQLSSRTSVRRPVTAAAAAIAGLTRCVRPPGPWRPMKLRFEVEAQRSPLTNWSGSYRGTWSSPPTRQSKPASSRGSCPEAPLASAWAFAPGPSPVRPSRVDTVLDHFAALGMILGHLAQVLNTAVGAGPDENRDQSARPVILVPGVQTHILERTLKPPVCLAGIIHSRRVRHERR